MTGRGLIVAGLACVLGACTPYDATPDGGAPIADAGGLESAAPLADSAIPPDAGTDGGVSFCAAPLMNAATIFCEDFEDNPQSRWTPETVGANSMVRLAARPGGTGMALESIVAAQLPQNRSASWTRALAAPPVLSHLRYSYALYVVARPNVGSYEVAIMGLETGSESCQFYLVVKDTGAAVGEQRCPTGSRQLPLGLVIPTNQWVRLSFEVNLSPTAKTIEVLLDGQKALTSDLLYVAPGKPIPTAGITYANEATISGHVLMDDILLESLP